MTPDQVNEALARFMGYPWPSAFNPSWNESHFAQAFAAASVTVQDLCINYVLSQPAKDTRSGASPSIYAARRFALAPTDLKALALAEAYESVK